MKKQQSLFKFFSQPSSSSKIQSEESKNEATTSTNELFDDARAPSTSNEPETEQIAESEESEFEFEDVTQTQSESDCGNKEIILNKVFCVIFFQFQINFIRCSCTKNQEINFRIVFPSTTGEFQIPPDSWSVFSFNVV